MPAAMVSVKSDWVLGDIESKAARVTATEFQTRNSLVRDLGSDDEVLWLIVGVPEELDFLQGSKSKIDLSLFYPVAPKKLPKELAGVEWPRAS